MDKYKKIELAIGVCQVLGDNNEVIGYTAMVPDVSEFILLVTKEKGESNLDALNRTEQQAKEELLNYIQDNIDTLNICAKPLEYYAMHPDLGSYSWSKIEIDLDKLSSRVVLKFPYNVRLKTSTIEKIKNEAAKRQTTESILLEKILNMFFDNINKKENNNYNIKSIKNEDKPVEVEIKGEEYEKKSVKIKEEDCGGSWIYKRVVEQSKKV